jgi:hypothetical protein
MLSPFIYLFIYLFIYSRDEISIKIYVEQDMQRTQKDILWCVRVTTVGVRMSSILPVSEKAFQ